MIKINFKFSKRANIARKKTEVLTKTKFTYKKILDK